MCKTKIRPLVKYKHKRYNFLLDVYRRSYRRFRVISNLSKYFPFHFNVSTRQFSLAKNLFYCMWHFTGVEAPSCIQDHRIFIIIIFPVLDVLAKAMIKADILKNHVSQLILKWNLWDISCEVSFIYYLSVRKGHTFIWV